jgi:hypothetical protein
MPVQVLCWIAVRDVVGVDAVQVHARTGRDERVLGTRLRAQDDAARVVVRRQCAFQAAVPAKSAAVASAAASLSDRRPRGEDATTAAPAIPAIGTATTSATSTSSTSRGASAAPW